MVLIVERIGRNEMQKVDGTPDVQRHLSLKYSYLLGFHELAVVPLNYLKA